jgi:hypothetical protein
MQATLDTRLESFRENTQKSDRQSHVLQDLQLKRQQLYGKKQPDSEEQQLVRAIEAADGAVRSASLAAVQAQRIWTSERPRPLTSNPRLSSACRLCGTPGRTSSGLLTRLD